MTDKLKSFGEFLYNLNPYLQYPSPQKKKLKNLINPCLSYSMKHV